MFFSNILYSKILILLKLIFKSFTNIKNILEKYTNIYKNNI